VTTHLDYDGLRAETVRDVAKLMAAAAITAPKSGGMLFIQGKHLFIETVIVDDRPTLDRMSAWMRARGKERRETIWFRDADVADAIDAVLLVGLADWYPPNYDCGACGYATCAEFLHATSDLRADSGDLEFVGPQCNLRDKNIDEAIRLDENGWSLALVGERFGVNAETVRRALRAADIALRPRNGRTKPVT
jgi:uncharacterized ferredoxin-like protein